MVDPVPTGTLITDPILIRIFRGTPVGTADIFYTTDPHELIALKLFISLSLGGHDIIDLTYMGVLDEKYSTYIGEWLNRVLAIKVNKNINPDTHDVYIEWARVKSNYDKLKAYKAELIIKRKEVMKW